MQNGVVVKHRKGRCKLYEYLSLKRVNITEKIQTMGRISGPEPALKSINVDILVWDHIHDKLGTLSDAMLIILRNVFFFLFFRLFCRTVTIRKLKLVVFL